jgi:hypothetical protein
LRLSEHANTLPMVVDLFREHRSVRLAQARTFVHEELPACDRPRGWLAFLATDRSWFANWPGITTT